MDSFIRKIGVRKVEAVSYKNQNGIYSLQLPSLEMKNREEVLKLPRFQCYKNSTEVKGVFYSEVLELYYIALEKSFLFQDGVEYTNQEIINLEKSHDEKIVKSMHACKKVFPDALIL